MEFERLPPAYQEYASDMLSRRHFKFMSLEERGLLYSMKLECWVNKSVPADPHKLARYFGFQEEEIVKNLTENVLAEFEIKGESIVSPELDKYKIELAERRLKQSNGGKKSAAIKKAKASSNEASKASSNLQGTCKQLSSPEVSGGETGGVELIKNESLNSQDDHREWLQAYDSADTDINGFDRTY